MQAQTVEADIAGGAFGGHGKAVQDMAFLVGIGLLPFNHHAAALTSAEFFSASSDIRLIAQATCGEQAEPIDFSQIDLNKNNSR
ncbi:MAG: hypothetical protein EOP15_07590 [Pseudomonas sp.]|nr:MAG: hypothetical protein EOP15_07590 [Pseudomonas sp.]